MIIKIVPIALIEVVVVMLEPPADKTANHGRAMH
jgi:hypothetical protein